MKFLVDAQLPYRLAVRLVQSGHDALHTRALPNGNRTTDAELLLIAAREQRIVVSKDADFVNSYVLKQQPEKLLGTSDKISVPSTRTVGRRPTRRGFYIPGTGTILSDGFPY